MARIAGITLPAEKRVEIGLTYIFGIGRSKSIKILQEAKIDNDKKVKELTEEDVKKIREIIEKREKIEGVDRGSFVHSVRVNPAATAEINPLADEPRSGDRYPQHRQP